MHPSPSRPGRRRPRRCAVAAPAAVDARAVSAIPAHASPISAGRRTRTMRQSASSSRSSTRRDTPSTANATAGSNIGRRAIRLLASCSSGSTSTAKPGARASRARALASEAAGSGSACTDRRAGSSSRARSSRSVRSPPGMRYPPSYAAPGTTARSGSATWVHRTRKPFSSRCTPIEAAISMPSSKAWFGPSSCSRRSEDTLGRPDEGRVEQHARLGVAALLLLAHHQLAPPGGGRPVHPPERVAVAVLAGDQLVGVRVGAALQAVHARRRWRPRCRAPRRAG